MGKKSVVGKVGKVNEVRHYPFALEGGMTQNSKIFASPEKVS